MPISGADLLAKMFEYNVAWLSPSKLKFYPPYKEAVVCPPRVTHFDSIIIENKEKITGIRGNCPFTSFEGCNLERISVEEYRASSRHPGATQKSTILVGTLNEDA